MKLERLIFAKANNKAYANIKKISRDLRNNPTKAEKYLWSFLRKRKLTYSFRRQHVIDSFVVDFVCLDKRLIIEVDGEIHEKQKEADRQRTLKLESLDFNHKYRGFK